MLNSRILNVVNMYFNVFRENKVIAKISEFTVHVMLSYVRQKRIFKAVLVSSNSCAPVLFNLSTFCETAI